MKVGDLVRDISGVIGVILVSKPRFAKIQIGSSFAWIEKKNLEVLSESR